MDGVKVPLGTEIKTGVTNPKGYTLMCAQALRNCFKKSLLRRYNEFIVYDVKQIKFRYAVKLKFSKSLSLCSIAQLIDMTGRPQVLNCASFPFHVDAHANTQENYMNRWVDLSAASNCWARAVPTICSSRSASNLLYSTVHVMSVWLSIMLSISG